MTGGNLCIGRGEKEFCNCGRFSLNGSRDILGDALVSSFLVNLHSQNPPQKFEDVRTAANLLIGSFDAPLGHETEHQMDASPRPCYRALFLEDYVYPPIYSFIRIRIR